MRKRSSPPRQPTTNSSGPPQPGEWWGWKWIVILILSGLGGYGLVRGVSGGWSWFIRSQVPNEKPLAVFDPFAHAASPPIAMIRIPGGTFRMGTKDPSPHFADAPEHEV